MKRFYKLIGLLLLASQSVLAVESTVKIKDLARFDGVRDNALTGYGLVIGLARTGDSARSKATLQSIKNTLENFDLVVTEKDIASRNVAAVLVTATLPAFAQEGDKIDVQISSIGDAKSLVGGSLILTPLKAVNGEVYALAQGELSVGGYQFEKFDNIVQKNHPTVGRIPSGATVEVSINNQFVQQDGSIHLILDEPDFTTIDRVVTRLNRLYPQLQVEGLHASRIKIAPRSGSNLISLIAKIENTLVAPAKGAKVVVNERTGTIVSGADIMIDNVVITHGSLKLTVNTDFLVSQPTGLFVGEGGLAGVETQVIPNSEIAVEEQDTALYVTNQKVSIADVMDALLQLKLSTRDIISILQALKKSGALHAELIIQ